MGGGPGGGGTSPGWRDCEWVAGPGGAPPRGGGTVNGWRHCEWVAGLFIHVPDYIYIRGGTILIHELGLYLYLWRTIFIHVAGQINTQIILHSFPCTMYEAWISNDIV